MAAARGEGSQRGDWGGDGFVMMMKMKLRAQHHGCLRWDDGDELGHRMNHTGIRDRGVYPGKASAGRWRLSIG